MRLIFLLSPEGQICFTHDIFPHAKKNVSRNAKKKIYILEMHKFFFFFFFIFFLFFRTNLAPKVEVDPSKKTLPEERRKNCLIGSDDIFFNRYRLDSSFFVVQPYFKVSNLSLNQIFFSSSCPPPHPK